MQIFNTLNPSFPINDSLVLTIGNFDGMHRGHQSVLKKLIQTAKKENALSAVLTFENHPSTVLRPNHPTPLICHPDFKISLLNSYGVDILISIPFTSSFAEQTAEAFLLMLRKNFPFTHLILGHDATLGKEKKGDKNKIESLANEFDFKVEYLSPLREDNHIVSSSMIRNAIFKGDLLEASQLLGRPFSIFGTVVRGRGVGKSWGFPTANIQVQGLCLPPLGIYTAHMRIIKPNSDIQISQTNDWLPGVISLGIAPTVRNDQTPILEIHLIDYTGTDFYNSKVEVIFHQFLRSEIKFTDIEVLKQQIAFDIIEAKRLLKESVG